VNAVYGWKHSDTFYKALYSLGKNQGGEYEESTIVFNTMYWFIIKWL
jgi:hypothetical protein